MVVVVFTFQQTEVRPFLPDRTFRFKVFYQNHKFLLFCSWNLPELFFNLLSITNFPHNIITLCFTKCNKKQVTVSIISAKIPPPGSQVPFGVSPRPWDRLSQIQIIVAQLLVIVELKRGRYRGVPEILRDCRGLVSLGEIDFEEVKARRL